MFPQSCAASVRWRLGVAPVTGLPVVKPASLLVLTKELTMTKYALSVFRKGLTSLSVVALFGLAFTGNPATAGQRNKHRNDARTCQRFGAQYGTAAYSDCMIEQQRRRDTKELDTLEKMRLTSQIAKDGQVMAERARRQRCDRDPDRRECRR